MYSMSELLVLLAIGTLVLSTFGETEDDIDPILVVWLTDNKILLKTKLLGVLLNETSHKEDCVDITNI